AIYYYEERLLIAKTIKDNRSQEQARASLKTACYAMGDYARAMEYD
ncbi:MAG: tetratricopeptide repeat protein, partial [Cyanobacteria bacterium P01_D01_bin.50]